jgi:hypothetical protein
VHGTGPREERLTAVANEDVNEAHATLVVSPDNQSRQVLNDVIHRDAREGHVDSRRASDLPENRLPSVGTLPRYTPTECGHYMQHAGYRLPTRL